MMEYKYKDFYFASNLKIFIVWVTKILIKLNLNLLKIGEIDSNNIFMILLIIAFKKYKWNGNYKDLLIVKNFRKF